MLILVILATVGLPAGALPVVEVLVEEDIFSFDDPKNGSGPLWSYGCTQIVRHRADVIVSQQETGKDVPPLCNTRWRLLRRGENGWQAIAEAEGFRQREPCPLGIIGDSLYVNVNDSLTPPGTHYKPCRPALIKFDLHEAPLKAATMTPRWEGQPYFTDHSYRGFSVDHSRRELLMLNVDNRTTLDQSWCYLTAAGETIASGSVHFPFRGCYSQVALVNRAAHVMAISDIVEPVEGWRQYKYEQTKRDWDYVFRILYYTWSPDLSTEPFATPIEVANVDATGGHIGNQDLWIAPDGRAYVMYTEREVASALLRDRFFPERSILNSLRLAVIQDGRVIERYTLVEGTEERAAHHARFHTASDGRLYALLYVTGGESGNELMPIHPVIQPDSTVPVPLEVPFQSYCLASVRAGNPPSDVIDVFGFRADSHTLSYAAIRIPQKEE